MASKERTIKYYINISYKSRGLIYKSNLILKCMQYRKFLDVYNRYLNVRLELETKEKNL